VSTSDRPSHPHHLFTPVDGFVRPGLVYIDDSETALRAMRRALYPHGLLIETFLSLEAYRSRGDFPLVGALLDVQLEGGVSGLDVARVILAEHPGAAIAFITAEMAGERDPDIRALGPVFVKDRDVAHAVEWLIARGKQADAVQSG
jgi:hypothetical protein